MGRALTEEVKLRIHQMLREGHTGTSIAGAVGCGTATVAGIKKALGLSKEYHKKVKAVDLQTEGPTINLTPSPAARALAEFDPIIARALGMIVGEG